MHFCFKWVGFEILAFSLRFKPGYIAEQKYRPKVSETIVQLAPE